MKKMTMMGSLTLTRAIWKALKRERTTISIQSHDSVLRVKPVDEAGVSWSPSYLITSLDVFRGQNF